MLNTVLKKVLTSARVAQLTNWYSGFYASARFNSSRSGWLTLFWLVAAAPAIALQPYSPDGSTLHLWHLDETNTPCLDSAADGVNLAALSGGARLTNLAFAGFGGCVSTFDGGPNGTFGNQRDAVLSAAGVNTDAIVTYCDPNTSAFTYEAIVHIEFDPTKNFGPTSVGGNGRNTPFQILNADGNTNPERIFQFRVDPIGFQAFSGDTSSNLVRLEFINLAQGGSIQNILTAIPTTGGDAIVSNDWYHVAVTYSGTLGVPGNINFYWTLLSSNRTQATLIDDTQTMLDSLAGSSNATVFTVGNAGRNPSGNPAQSLNANFLGRIDEVRISSVPRVATDMLFSGTGLSILSGPTPTNQLVGTGQPFSITVSASGQPPPQYQWRLNSSPVTNATNNVFSVASAQSTNSGIYDVLVSNNTGSLTSGVAVVAVTNLAIVSQPASLTAGYASTATLSVDTVGLQPIYYQWLESGVAIAGATNDTLTLTPLVSAEQGSYSVVVSNSAGSVTSVVATLTLVGPQVTLIPVTDGSTASGYGYAGASDNAVNAVPFICSGLQTLSNQQFIAYYGQHQTDPSYPYNGTIWIGRRSLSSNTWDIYRTTLTPDDITDGHDVVSFGIDGEGYMHLSWGMHDQPLNYAISTGPVTGNLPISFGPKTNMVGFETSVTYPQFLTMPNGDLLFLYRIGASGGGDTYLNRYVLSTHTWTNVNETGGIFAPFIKGNWSSATNYNAYPNMPCLDAAGNLFVVWTWRETSAYQSNHDFLYGQSSDGGVTWQRSDNSTYTLPICQHGEAGPNSVAETIIGIPQNSSLINQAGMCLDGNNNPVIATWWAPGTATNNFQRQYMVAFPDSNGMWQVRQISNRTNDPSNVLEEDGAVRDLGRPVVVADKDNRIIVVYRDNFGSNGLTVVHSLPYAVDPLRTNWTSVDLTTDNLGSYEPVIDLARWQRDNVLDILYQPCTSTTEGYTAPSNTAAPIGVLEWNAAAYFHPNPTLQMAFTNANQNVTLTWPSQTGWGYELQTSTNLPTWDSLSTLSGNESALHYVHTNATAVPARFWRLQIREGGF